MMDLFGIKRKRRKQEISRLHGMMRQHGLILVRKDSFSELASLFNLTGEDITLTNLADRDPWAKRGIDMIGNMAKVIPWKVVNSDTEEDIERGDLIEWIKEPAFNQSREDFVYEALGWLVICGRFLAHKEFPISNSIRNMKLLLVPVSKNKLQFVLNKTGGLTALRTPINNFIYDGETILRDDAVYTYIWSSDPTKRHMGAGLLPSAQYDLGANVSAAEMSYDLMKKGGVPPYYMSSVEVLDDDEFGQVKTQIHSLIKGSTNIKNVPMLPGGFKIETVQQSAKDMQLVELRKHNREAIATALGMSIAMLTSGMTTFENNKMAKILTYESVIKPLLNKVLEAINRDLIMAYTQKEKIVADYSTVRALEPEYDKFAKAIPFMLKIMTSGGVNSLAPWDIPEEYQREVQALPFAQSEPTPEPKSSVYTGLLFGDTDEAEKEAEPLEDKKQDIRRKEYWLKRKGEFDSYARECTQRVRKLYRQQRSSVNEYVDTLNDDLSDVKHVEQWMSWTSERERFASRIHGALMGIVKDAASVVTNDLGGEFVMNDRHVKKITEFASVFAKRVNDNTYAQLDEVVKQILSGERNLSMLIMKATGEDYDVEPVEDEDTKTKKELLIAAVVSLYLFADEVRAPLAGHKEAHNSQGFGLVEGGRSAGADTKDWLASFVQRQAHMAVDGQRVKLDEAFMVDGEALQWPGDMAGSPGNTLNCYCTVEIIPSLGG